MEKNYFSKIIFLKEIFHSLEKINYLSILEILKSKIDLVLKEFKSLKQKILKKMNKKENFYKIKDEFLKTYCNDKKSK